MSVQSIGNGMENVPVMTIEEMQHLLNLAVRGGKINKDESAEDSAKQQKPTETHVIDQLA